jgi:hypothetical protein
MAVQVVVGVVSASLAVLWRLRWRHLYALRTREGIARPKTTQPIALPRRESRNNSMTDA